MELIDQDPFGLLADVAESGNPDLQHEVLGIFGLTPDDDDCWNQASRMLQEKVNEIQDCLP